LLEIGAGTGQDGAYFQAEGLAVVAADLSPVMVEHCGYRFQSLTLRRPDPE
jgi:SAM-dependent methyltransferase